MKRLTNLAPLIVVLLLVVGCSDPGSDGETEGTETTAAAADGAAITIADFSFSGATSVAVGETVTVTNNDSVGHTWTAEDGTFDSGTLAEGESFDFTFAEAGDFDFVCSIHPQMEGTITVES